MIACKPKPRDGPAHSVFCMASACARLGQALPDDLDDADHVPAVPLHQADKHRTDAECTDVFSSKIIHQETNRRDRFDQMTTFMKILLFNFPDITAASGPPWPRPLKSPFPCFQCHRPFPGPPIFIPMSMLDGIPEEWGNFCGGPCALTYLDRNMRDAFSSERKAAIMESLRVVHGFTGTSVGMAPHFTERQCYGGSLSDAAFQTIVDMPNLSTEILRKPFCPTLEVVEYKCVAPPGQDGKVAAKILEDVMGTAAPALDHHQQWNVNNLQQPSVDATVRRLASLPQADPIVDPDQIPFNVFVEAKRAAEAEGRGGNGGAAAVVAPTPAAPKRARAAPKRAAAAAAAAAADSAPAGLGGLVAQAPPKKRVRKTATVATAAPATPVAAAAAAAAAPT